MSAIDTGQKKNGYVFNVQRYSVHDGPGIRTIVFLKGCPLKCRWCANPESQHLLPELALNHNKCIGTKECSMCLDICENEAIQESDEGKVYILRDRCKNCTKCADTCPSRALNIYGKAISVNEVLKVVEEDSVFYSRSGGGITMSGGEPLVQPLFACELVKEAKRRRMNTALETCGHTDWESLDNVCRHLNTIMYDIKSMDPEKHKEFTGVSNELILDNFKKLCANYPSLSIVVRTPVIPGFNDTEEEIQAIIDFIKQFPQVEYELLPYHRLGQPKYEYLGKEYPLPEVTLDNEKMKLLNQQVRQAFSK